jgi:hypothetical protein
VKTGGKLRSDLLFEIWRQLGNARMSMPQPAVTLALPTVMSRDIERH